MFISFVGVPGVGKTTLALAVAKQLHAKIFIEPGTDAWPIPPELWQQHVAELERWVCTTNSKNFHDARMLADAGNIAITDTALFLINRELIHAPCCDWYYGLMSPAERAQTYQQAEIDWKASPCPDILILLELDSETWRRYLQARGRSMDDDEEFINNYTDMQALIAAAAKQLVDEREIKLISYNNVFGSPEQNAASLVAEINQITTCSTYA